MTDQAAFLSHAWHVVARALVYAGVAADIDLHPATLLETVKRRCLAELRHLTVLIRRLIFLMALGMEVAPVPAREGRNWFRDEDAASAPRSRSLRIAPAPYGLPPACLRTAYSPAQPGPVEAAPVVARWYLLLNAVKYRERRAKRLARTLLRWQAAGEARPYVPPAARTHRVPYDLGLIAGVLPVLLNRALQVWPDTG